MAIQYIFLSVGHFCQKSNKLDPSYQTDHSEILKSGLLRGGRVTSLKVVFYISMHLISNLCKGWSLVGRDYCIGRHETTGTSFYISIFCSFHTIPIV